MTVLAAIQTAEPAQPSPGAQRLGSLRNNPGLDAAANREPGLPPVSSMLSSPRVSVAESIDRFVAGKVTTVQGPPTESVDDLMDASSWLGRPILLCAQRATRPAEPAHGQDGKVEPNTTGIMRVLIQLRNEDGKKAWMELPFADLAPGHGAAMEIRGNTLHITGGLDESGQPSCLHLSYDLGQGLALGFPAHLWQKERDLPSRVAWHTTARCRDQVFYLNGIAAYAVGQGGKRDDAKTVFHRRLFAESARGTRELAPPDKRLVGCSWAAINELFVVGPGNNFDGEFLAYSPRRHGGWRMLPAIPRELGRGQLHVDGHVVYYTGGFVRHQDGSLEPSATIFQLDLDNLEAGWQVRGQSDYLAGAARLVESYGRPMAVLLKPGKSLSAYG